jgi:hypothetical protein
MKKKLILPLALGCFLIGSVSASAMSFNTFFGGVTGVPGYGTTYAQYLPRGKRVYVTASGKTTLTRYAYSGGNASATVSRAFSGNRAWWGLW